MNVANLFTADDVIKLLGRYTRVAEDQAKLQSNVMLLWMGQIEETFKLQLRVNELENQLAEVEAENLAAWDEPNSEGLQ